ncbi:hypothetical protein Pst134EB_001625 [Puccinia striiformis f. sp. tritici]|nr:hypothetical protein Pst134EB_001625 [Puccinia striiformis f. sp. tritici]
MQVKSQLYPSTRVKIRDSKDSGALKSLMNDNNRHIEIVKISAQQEDAMNGGGLFLGEWEQERGAAKGGSGWKTLRLDD